jgi:hypothetical protein
MSSSPTPVHPALLQQWIAGKLDSTQLRENLIAQGPDEAAVAHQLNEYRKIKYARRQFTGFIYLGAGALIGFISCVHTLINPVPELYNWILFGLTSIEMVFIFVGLYYLFE